MAWIYLLAAGLFEIGWPLGFKLAQTANNGYSPAVWLTLSVISMAASGYLLFLAQKVIPIGTAYAAWAGIGAVGTYIIGILLFNDSASVLSWIGLLCIVSGITMLKISSFAR